MSPLTNILLSSAALPWWLSVSLKAALVLAAAWLGATILRRSAAAARHQVWTLGVVGALSMPLLCWALPSLLSWSPALIGDQGAVAEATEIVHAMPALIAMVASQSALPRNSAYQRSDSSPGGKPI